MTVGLRHASVLPLDLFDGLLDPAIRSQLAVLRGYGVAGQATSSLGGVLDSCLFLPELCLTTAKAADAAPPSKNRPLLIGAAMAVTGRKRCSNHDSKADVTELDIIISSSPGPQQQHHCRYYANFARIRKPSWRRTTVHKLNNAKNSAQTAEFDFAKCPPPVSIIASGMSYGCSRVPNDKGFLAKV